MIASSNVFFLGLDVAKAKADVCLLAPDGKSFEESFANTRAGYASLLAWLEKRARGLLRAGLESTGPYARPWCQLLHAAGHAVFLLNPARPKAYGQALGLRNKTDRVDARLLARFVAEQKARRWSPPAPDHEELKELTRRREDLLALRQAEQNRLASAPIPRVRASLQRSIKSLEQEVERVEAELDGLMARSPRLRRDEELLCTIDGIGKVTARKVLAELPAAESFTSARQAAAYAGLSPRVHESGQSVRKKGRLSKIGNPALRKALFMPSLVAMEHNPLLKAFAQRLRAKGKPKMAIVGAVMRKLLHIIFGILKHQKPFDPNYGAR
jgi:transposase